MVESQLSVQHLASIPRYVLSTGHPIPEARKDIIISDDFYIGTFGFQTEVKDPERTYTLIAKLASHLDCRAVIVGEVSIKLKSMALQIWKHHQNTKELSFLSGLDDERFEREIAGAGLGIQLRRRTNGESSGPVSQLLANCIPTIVTDIGAFSELDAPLVHKISPKENVNSRTAIEQMISWVSSTLDGQVLDAQLEWNQKNSYKVAAAEIAKIISSNQ